MFQAALVEDEPQVRSYLKDQLIASFKKQNCQLSFDVFSSGSQFLAMFEKHYHFDVVFLDIEMPEMDGISICRKIRDVSRETLVIFISNKEELVFQTFEVQPFRFIRKSEFERLLPSLTESVIQKFQENENKTLRITEPTSGDLYSFEIQSIVYIEAQRKYCRIVTTTGEKSLLTRLMDWEASLNSYQFIKPHRSYLVNPKYITYIGKKNILLKTSEEIPISRGNLDRVKQAFLSYTIG